MTKLDGANFKGAYLDELELRAVEVNKSERFIDMGQCLVKILKLIRENNLSVTQEKNSFSLL